MRNLDGWKGLGQLGVLDCLRGEKFFSLVRDEEEMYALGGKQETEQESLPDELHGK